MDVGVGVGGTGVGVGGTKVGVDICPVIVGDCDGDAPVGDFDNVAPVDDCDDAPVEDFDDVALVDDCDIVAPVGDFNDTNELEVGGIPVLEPARTIITLTMRSMTTAVTEKSAVHPRRRREEDRGKGADPLNMDAGGIAFFLGSDSGESDSGER